jgi:hypothetical protein
LPVRVVGDDKAIELDVTRVALFSSGVGYFECDASVNGSATAELKFRTDQINDILKSLVVQDFGGGTIGVVSYASRDPIEKTLKSFGVDITGKPTLAQLLDQLRGEPVEISGPSAVKGIILGVEKHKQTVKDQVIETDVVNILTDGGMQQLEVRELQGIKLTNEKVDGELRKALATLALAHDADKKSVVISFNGMKERKVRAAYLLEAPIWKTSYRLVLADGKKPFLQGWATVENATEEDWKNIRLSLISGRPISFRMDLYSPIYIPRPIEQLELYASLRPPEYEGGFAGPEEKEAAKALAPAAAPERARKRVAAGRAADKAAAEADAEALGMDGKELRAGVELQGAGVESVAAAAQAGELFEYTIQTPVSIPRQHSAMLPIVNEEVDGEKVSIFNAATHPKHPLNGLELTNSTKLNLMQGPVTLFDANVYAGDAKLPDMKPAEKRLIAYALDLATEVLTKTKAHPDEIVSLRIAKGTLWHRHKYVDEREYDVKNKSNKDKAVILEQSYTDDWKLVEPKEPYERTQNLLRFKIAAPPAKTVTYKVQLERIADQSVALTELGLDQIRFYLSSRVISAEVKEALERVIALRTELDNASRKRALLEQKVNEAAQEQGRIRENIKTLPQNTDAYKRQVTKLDTLESQIEELRGQIAEARADEEAKRKALQDYLLGLNVE